MADKLLSSEAEDKPVGEKSIKSMDTHEPAGGKLHMESGLPHKHKDKMPHEKFTDKMASKLGC